MALLQLPAPFDRSPMLQRGRAQLVYSLRTHRALRSAMHLLSPDVFYGTAMPLPGLLPQRDQGGLLAAPLARPDARALQASCRLTAGQIRVVLPQSMEAEMTKAAYTALQAPPPRGGRTPPVPSRVTTGQRRLLVALHSGHAILADKSAANAPPPAPPSADGRQVTPPPGSLIAPRALALEEMKSGFSRDNQPPPGSLVLLSLIHI